LPAAATGYFRSIGTPNTQTDFITLLVGQHREVDQMFVQLEKMDGSSSDEAQRLAEQVVRSLALAALAPGAGLVDRLRDALTGRAG
jgi:hypothetical protein